MIYGANATEKQVRSVELRRPEGAGSHWVGIPHDALLSVIEEECEQRGWILSNPKFALTSDKADLVGCYRVDFPDLENIPGMSFELGFITSNARRRSLRLLTGATVSVCTNGLISGEIILQQKHVDFDLQRRISNALVLYQRRCTALPTQVKKLRHRKLSEEDYARTLMAAGRLKLLTWSKIGRVDKEYRKPRFKEYGKSTSWTLLNAFTWVAKELNPHRQVASISKFMRLLPSASYVSKERPAASR